MEDVEFSPEFCRFIKSMIPDMEAAELLLLFQSRPEARLTPAETAAKLGLGIGLGQVNRHLDVFKSRGLLSEAEGRYQYRPDSELAAFAASLAQAYTQRPVTLVRIVYALRDSSIQSFADAFKLRRS